MIQMASFGVSMLRMIIKNINKNEISPGTNTNGSMNRPPVLFMMAKDTPIPTGIERKKAQKNSDNFVC
tara:strand:+ start:11729 stop:11932 length:204 start_codon:yes stop_codon:yes gene_type:complete